MKKSSKMPFGYNNETEKDIVQYVFAKKIAYSENPPDCLVEKVIQREKENGEQLTREEAAQRVTAEDIDLLIVEEINDKWGEFFKSSGVCVQENKAIINMGGKPTPIIEKQI